MTKLIALENLLDNLSTAVLLLDSDINIQFANLATESLFEHSRNQLISQPLNQYLLDDCIDISKLKHALQNKENFTLNEAHLVFRDGRHSLASVIVSFFEDEAGEWLSLEITPIDQQRKINRDNQQWALQQAARDLIRGLAHEIKNPLGGIRGAAQLLERELAEPSLKEFTQLIVEQSDRLRGLVDRLLGPNRPPNFAWHNIHRVIEKIRTLLSVEHQDIHITRDYDPSIPEVYIDQDMLQQALLNIARNAVQALGGKGDIHFSTRIQRHCVIHGAHQPLCVEIKITDNGPGIPEELKDTLFYPLVSSKLDGSGLGLSISQSLVNHHRGKIDVDSWPGQTEFSILLPLDKKEQE
ncbi:MAG: nitrogen regulation protein NR(II) [Aestuariibacter sp.]